MFDTLGDPFDAGPYAGVQLRLRLGRPCERVKRRALAGALIAWVPLVVLWTGEVLATTGQLTLTPVLYAFATHARYLAAIPLLLIAEPWCLPRLSRIAWHLAESGIVTEEDWPRYADALARTRRLLRSRRVDLILVAMAYAITFLRASTPGTGQLFIAESSSRSLAEWWRLLVSQPLFILLLLSWAWRVLLWGQLLFQVSRLRLRLLASHPDGAGGLGFLRGSIVAFVPLASALGAVVAGVIAREVIVQGRNLQDFELLVTELVVVVVVLFAGPLLVFVPPLRAARGEAVFAYGELVTSVGRQFEQKWVGTRAASPREVLSASDFSAMIDLSTVVANVHALRPAIFDLRSIIPLLVATVVPLAPLLFVALPPEHILSIVGRLLL